VPHLHVIVVDKLLLMARNYYFYNILCNLFHISLKSMSSLYTTFTQCVNVYNFQSKVLLTWFCVI